MDSSASNSENESYQTDDSEYNYIPGPRVIDEPTEVEEVVGILSHDLAEETSVGPYADEPVADEEWLAKYKEKRQTYDERLLILQNRLDGKEDVRNWCKCKNCDTQLLQNAKECQCCVEIEECVASLNTEEVTDPPLCVADHPGFNTICLDKWSLRLAAAKYRTRQKKQYRQTGSEEKFFRSTAYRGFTWLVHGHLGNKRYPLPACAYHKIRKEFADSRKDFSGFEEEDNL